MFTGIVVDLLLTCLFQLYRLFIIYGSNLMVIALPVLAYLAAFGTCAWKPSPSSLV